MAMKVAKELFTKQTKEEIFVDEDAIRIEIEKDKEETVPQKVEQNGKLESIEDNLLNS